MIATLCVKYSACDCRKSGKEEYGSSAEMFAVCGGRDSFFAAVPAAVLFFVSSGDILKLL